MELQHEMVTEAQRAELAKLRPNVTWYFSEDGDVIAVDLDNKAGVTMTTITHDGITHTETHENGEWVLRGPDGSVIPDPELVAVFDR